jgi:arylsulfatase A-like enzyme
MLADDMGWGSISNDVSPFMYKMAKKGVSLTKYYSQEACTPARAALLTGRYPLSMGLQYYEHSVDETGGLPLDETTFAEVMSSAGYMTYMLGKWNLGNASPRYLPTARGFDYFLGYMDGFTNYWSKTSPDNPEFKDFMFADTECYYEYDGEDINTYSTVLYQDRAIDIIKAHDYKAYPMFMYLAFQAVHDPFSETEYPEGVPNDYLDKSTRKYIEKTYDGHMQQQYFKSLAILDKAVENIYYALDDQGVLDNTYLIFASDNGGCPSGGGRNYPFRGTKGSFFEGGVHVESFMYSPTYLKNVAGKTYDGLFHVSDWFPTMLDMAGLFYIAPFGKELDGVSHYNALVSDEDCPRDYLLINYYYDPYRGSETLWTGKAVAIRDKQYKLLHTYTSLGSSAWYEEKEVYATDDELDRHTGCGQVNAVNNGDFTVRKNYDL